MATPDEYIVIDNFSPGIHGDLHAASSPRYTADASLAGAVPGNGMARVDGTVRCRADRSGALVPLPLRQASTMVSALVPTTGQDAAREGMYLLDAQIDTPTTSNEQKTLPTTINPGTVSLDGFPTWSRSDVGVTSLWGFYRSPDSNPAYQAYVLGTQYRPWDTTNPRLDFLFARSAMPKAVRVGTFPSGGMVDGIGVGQAGYAPLPAGSLLKSRFYYGNTVWGQRIIDTLYDSDPLFRLEWWYPTTVAVVSSPWPRWPAYNAFVQGDITATELTWIDSASIISPVVRYATFPSTGNNYVLGPIPPALAAPADIEPHDESYYDFYLCFDIEPASALISTTEILVTVGVASPTLNWKLERNASTDCLVFSWSSDGTSWDNSVTDASWSTPASRQTIGLGIVCNYTNGDDIESGSYVRLHRPDNGNKAEAPIIDPDNNIDLSPNGLAGIRLAGDGTSANYRGLFYQFSVSKDMPNTPYALRRPTQFRRVGSDVFYPDVLPVTSGTGNNTFASFGSNWNGEVDTTAWTWSFSQPSATTAKPFTTYTPAIGPSTSTSTVERPTAGTIIGMSLNNSTGWDIPAVPGGITWSWHYQDEGWFDDVNFRQRVPNAPYLGVSHQGRLLFLDRRLTGWVGSMRTLDSYVRNWDGSFVSRDVSDYRSLDDHIWYSDYGLPLQSPIEVDPGTGTPTTPYPSDARQASYYGLNVMDDVVADVGTVGVATTDQVIFIKHRGGGALVSGDIENPSIRRLPYIESTHGVVTKGAQTPIGYVYGSRNGIYAWQGGDSSKKLSPQIDGFFWDHTDGNEAEQYAGQHGRFAYWNGLVAVPNDYVYDIESDAWWRLESPEGRAFNTYDESDGNVLYAFPYKQVANDAPIWYEYDQNVLDTDYSWQSHPLIETRGRTVSFQNVQIIATGTTAEAATIDITLEGLDVTGGQLATRTVAFTLDDTANPQLLRADIEPNFNAEYVTVKIEAHGAPAPKIHSLQLGTKQRATTRRHGGE